MTKRRAIALLLTLALAASGCSDPYTSKSPKPSTGTPEGELPGPVPTAERQRLRRATGQPSGTPQAAARAFALAYLNWTDATVARRYRALSRRATGQARQELLQTAASAGTDPQLIGTRAANRGTVSGVIEQPGGWMLLVSHERLTPGGGQTEPPRHRVYRVHAAPQAGGFVVDHWQGQP